jgi:hypothetical protein
VVASLSARGQAGAAKLVDRFAGPAPGVERAPGWEYQLTPPPTDAELGVQSR